jgi:uncharacterized membrane protein
MVIMAIDHVRDMLHFGHPDATDLRVTTPALFFVRWLTHFCAPTFVLLSGVSAYLAGRRRSRGELAGFLIKRGFWLILVELFVINLATSADFYYRGVVLQVIWAIGASMVLLGVLVALRASVSLIGGIGLVIFLGHNIPDLFPHAAWRMSLVCRILLTSNGFGSVDQLGHGHFLIASYAVLPWAGVMLMGYALGMHYTQDAAKRRRMLTRLGLILLGVFVVFRAFNWYGDPAPWSVQKNLLWSAISFLNVTKYPCSLLYLCMTLGVALLFLAGTERAGGWLVRVLIVYGSVPFFYYTVHWFLIQGITVSLFFGMGHPISEAYKSEFPFSPANFGLPLGGVLGVWLVVVVALYYPCRWFGRYKKIHNQWWLSYL